MRTSSLLRPLSSVHIFSRRLYPPKTSHQLLPNRDFTSSSSSISKNRIYDSVRNSEEFSTLLLLSASSRRPLLTLWTASFCPSCRVVLPCIKDAIEKDRYGEPEGGVGFAEIEVDAVGMGVLGAEYFINSMPTLLSFNRQEAQLATKIVNVDEMKDREFLKLWIENEARRGGAGGAGGSRGVIGGLFGMGAR